MQILLPRDLDPKSEDDCGRLDTIIKSNVHGNVRLDRDWIMVMDSPDDPYQFTGVVVARPVMYVHEFQIADLGLNAVTQRSVAESLLGYAISKGSMAGERDAVFTVARDNATMNDFIKSRGGIPQPDGNMWTMPVPRRFYPRRPGE